MRSITAPIYCFIEIYACSKRDDFPTFCLKNIGKVAVIVLCTSKRRMVCTIRVNRVHHSPPVLEMLRNVSIMQNYTKDILNDTKGSLNDTKDSLKYIKDSLT